MSSEDVRRSLADADGPDYYLATLAVYEEAAQIRVLTDAIEELQAERVRLAKIQGLDCEGSTPEPPAPPVAREENTPAAPAVPPAAPAVPPEENTGAVTP